MTVRVYRSTDASAPVLTGQVGSLTALLDAVLVNGYGALTAAGWTINQTTTNKRGYKQNLTGANNSSGMLLYVDDTGPGAAGAKEARLCGFETMSAITPVGTGQFPTSGQSAIGVGTVACRKSVTADATARAWTIIANGQTIYLFIESGDFTQPLGTVSFIFGDFKSYKASDQYAVWIMGRLVENRNLGDAELLQVIGGAFTLNSKYAGHYIARTWTGLGGSVTCGKTTDFGRVVGTALGPFNGDNVTTSGNSSTFTFGRILSTQQLALPNGPDGALVVSPVYLFHGYSFRGYLPGLWCPMHDRPLSHNDTLTVASGNLNGKSLLCQQIVANINNNTSDVGQCLVEYSDTWT
jgi:hypothetical protein